MSEVTKEDVTQETEQEHQRPSYTGRWIFGGAMTVLGLYGLLAAAQARDTGFYIFGLLLFLFAVMFVFSLIHKYTGDSNSH